MTKSKKKYRRKQKKTFPIIPVAVGLFLIGFAVLAMVSPKTEGNAASLNSVVPVEVNYAAPELSLQNIEGETESLADHLGSVVLVNNWATWCPPCKAEMPTLVAYHNEHSADGFSVIAVEAGEPADVVSQFVQSYGMKFPVWLDPNGAALRAFGNGTLPNSYVIDRTGTVRYAWTGEISKAMLEKYVTPLIEENN
ncbi:MAG: TlpA family protein disulfide reductase [Anaerolineales bacterium]|nr:TlpA family protein disulfide reductase [Anaerolineae bacterium]PWB72883.1 MAG: TlpA family protein disulfide reductase [Anaerolineales bacterium]